MGVVHFIKKFYISHIIVPDELKRVLLENVLLDKEILVIITPIHNCKIFIIVVIIIIVIRIVGR